jgi:dihydropteroate synthase
MGILNVTADSFSNDGIYKDPQRAKDLALEKIAEGADIIDVGGESSRPGAGQVCAQEEQARVLPVIKELAKAIDVPISIDTTKSEVAYAALQEGASIVNDISGLKFDARMPGVIGRSGAGCILMHIRGTPQTMQEDPFYGSLIEEIIEDLKESVSKAVEAGVGRERIVIDPGIGFGFSCLELPVLLGTSRKSFIGNVLGLSVDKRILGTAASAAAGILNGAHILRVHDVKEMVQVARVADAILLN